MERKPSPAPIQPARKGIQEYKMGQFESKVAAFGNQKVASDSMLILAHDTTLADVREVGEDKKAMEAHAKKSNVNVRIEHHTVSGLYQALRGQKP